MNIPEDNPSSVMDIISATSTAREAALAAIEAAKEQDFEQASKWLDRAQNAIKGGQLAHNHLLSLEARGEGPEFSLLLVHAETHLTDANAILDTSREFVSLYNLIYSRL